MEEKYLYFRNSTLADDDDSAASACFPLSSLAGMFPSDTGSTEVRLTLCFKSMANYDGFTATSNHVIISDTVELIIGTNNDHRDVMQSLVDLFASNQRDGMLVIADEATSEFCNSLITGIHAINIAGTSA